MRAYYKNNTKLGYFNASDPSPEHDVQAWINSIIDQVKRHLPRSHKTAILVTFLPVEEEASL